MLRDLRVLPMRCDSAASGVNEDGSAIISAKAHALGHGAILAGQALLQRGEPAPHRFERRTEAWGDDASMPDRGGGLLARRTGFVQAFAGLMPMNNVRCRGRVEAGEPDHPFGEIDDLHRLAMLRSRPRRRWRRPECMARRCHTRSQASRIVMK